MLFNSFQFIVFLPLVIILYYLLPHKIRWILLLAASYYFYMAWKPEYILLIVGSTIINYLSGILIEWQKDEKKRKTYLILSLFINLGLLFTFKYFNFFNRELGDIYTALTKNEYPIDGLKLLLPMGISFYTFQTLSYVIDVYKGTRKVERHFGYFALFVTYFPQLVAGPIERSEDLLPQLKKKHILSYDDAMSALLRICLGFFKKVIIADRVAKMVNTVYNSLPAYSGVYLIIATLGFALQIYCDFSAYSDIAIGSARIMGIELTENFKTPYFSKSIKEFWSRWHITLSSWFKDYLYIPLGGNRVNKKWKYYRNIILVFMISGLWHGAEWTFIIWGFLHGIYQITETFCLRVKNKLNLKLELPGKIRWLITFILVLIAWVFFRANNIYDAVYVFQNANFGNFSTLFDGKSLYSMGLDLKDFWLLIICTVGLTLTDYIKFKIGNKQLIYNGFTQGIVSVVLILLIIIFGYYGDFQSSKFIYFQF